MDPNSGSDLSSDPSFAVIKNLTDLAEIQEAFEQAQKEEVRRESIFVLETLGKAM